MNRKVRSVADVLGHNLRYYRQLQGLTQGEVAKMARLSSRQYQKLEAGKANATIESLSNVAGAFRVTIDQMLRLSFHRTRLSPREFICAFGEIFDGGSIGVAIRDMGGKLLLVNGVAQEILGLTDKRMPVDLSKVLKGPALEMLKNQLMCEQRGLVAPYLNYATKRGSGDRVYARHDPTLILPERGAVPYFSAIYIATPESACQESYYAYAEKLLNLP